MPKLVRISDGVEVKSDRGWVVTGTGDAAVRHPYRGMLASWTDAQLAAIGLRREADPPPPPPPPPPTTRQRIEREASRGVMSALVDQMAEDKGITRAQMLDLLEARMP